MKFEQKFIKVFQNMPKWLTVISDCNPRLKRRFAITSDSNPGFILGKTRRQKDGCSSYRVYPTWARITLYPCFLEWCTFQCITLDKEEKSSFYQMLSFLMILRESICENHGGTMKIFVKSISIYVSQSMTICSKLIKWVIDWVKNDFQKCFI